MFCFVSPIPVYWSYVVSTESLAVCWQLCENFWLQSRLGLSLVFSVRVLSHRVCGFCFEIAEDLRFWASLMLRTHSCDLSACRHGSLQAQSLLPFVWISRTGSCVRACVLKLMAHLTRVQRPFFETDLLSKLLLRVKG